MAGGFIGMGGDGTRVFGLDPAARVGCTALVHVTSVDATGTHVSGGAVGRGRGRGREIVSWLG